MSKQSLHTSIAVAMLIMLPLMMWLAVSPIGQTIDRLYYDLVLQGSGSEHVNNDIVIVGIDEASFAELNTQWPWPREFHSRLLETLYSQGASVVAFDIIFSEPSSAEADAAFSAAIQRWPNTLLAEDINISEKNNWVQQIQVKPAESLAVKDKQLGVINIPTQADGLVREINLAFGSEVALSLAAARKHKKSCCQDLPDDLRFLINYLGPAGSIKTVSYYQAMDPDKFLPPDYFRNKIVFVGTVTHSAVTIEKKAVDYFPVPSSRLDAGYMAGIEIHAHATHNLLHNTYIKPIKPIHPWLLSIACSIGFAFFLIRL